MGDLSAFEAPKIDWNPSPNLTTRFKRFKQKCELLFEGPLKKTLRWPKMSLFTTLGRRLWFRPIQYLWNVCKIATITPRYPMQANAITPTLLGQMCNGSGWPFSRTTFHFYLGRLQKQMARGNDFKEHHKSEDHRCAHVYRGVFTQRYRGTCHWQ